VNSDENGLLVTELIGDLSHGQVDNLFSVLEHPVRQGYFGFR
jgi:hypothetical protein